MEKEFKEAERFPLSNHVLCGNLRIFIDRLNLIGDIPIGIMEILILERFDFSIDGNFGMESPLPSSPSALR